MSVRPGREEWLRWFWLWDCYFAAGFVAVSALTVVDDDSSTPAKVAVISVMAVMAAWYMGYGRPHITEAVPRTQKRARIFATGVLVLLAVGVAIEGSATFALFAAYPLIFMSLDLRDAIPFVVVASLLPPLSELIREGAGTMIGVLWPSTLLSVALALAIGTWIHRIITQSEERGKLIRELEESREEIARLSRDAGVAAERSRLAAEIHDTLAQGFTSLVTLVQAAESALDGDREKARRHLALAARTARENLGEARALVAGLTPSALGTGSLDDAIRRQVDHFGEETGIAAAYRADGDRGELPTVLEVVLLRAVQESLTNVRKHSGAQEVSVCLRVDGSTATLRVSDDGAGFDPAGAFDGYGLVGMRNRAAQVDGTLVVHSGHKKGTTIELEVPL